MADEPISGNRTVIIENTTAKKMRKQYLDAQRAVLAIPEVRKAIESTEDGDDFKFATNISKSLDNITTKLSNAVSVTIISGVESSFAEGEKTAVIGVKSKLKTSENAKLDSICETATKRAREYGVTGHQFANRETNGLNISHRVWNFNQNFKSEMTAIIQNGIHEGKSADALTAELTKYLNNPTALFRRVRDKKTGKLVLSKAARVYHPGRGVYRSAYKNALRLARTEINAAYRMAEWQSYQNNPLVKGYRIKTSGNHPDKDICDQLQGEYPKSFKWTGWHPQCRCVMIPIVVSNSDFADFLKNRWDKGEEGQWITPGEISDLPSAVDEFVERNSVRIADAAVLPDWLTENDKEIKRARIIENAKARHDARTAEDIERIKAAWAAREKALQKEKILAEAKARHDARTAEDIERTIKAWYERKSILNYGRRMLNFAAFIKDIDTAALKVALAQGNSTAILNEAHKIKDLGKQIINLQYIDNPLQVARKFSMAEAIAADKGVESKLQSLAKMPLEVQAKKLKFEIEWVEKTKKYDTWKVAQDAYVKAYDAVNTKIEIGKVKESVKDSLEFAKTTKSKKVASLVSELNTLMEDSSDIAAIKAKADELIKATEKLKAAKAKKVTTAAASDEYAKLMKLTDDYLAAVKAAKGDYTSASLAKVKNDYMEYVTELGYKTFKSTPATPLPSGLTAAEVETATKEWLKATPIKLGYVKDKVGGVFFGDVDYIKGGHWNAIKDCENLAKSLKKYGVNVTAEELSIIARYTYKSGFINRYILKLYNPWETPPNASQKKLLDAYISAFNGVMTKLPKYNGVTFRGACVSKSDLKKGKCAMWNEIMNAYKKDGIWTCKPPMSTTANTDIPYFFASGVTSFSVSDPAAVLFVIKGKTGVRVSEIALDKTQDEVLFRAGTKFKIVNKPHEITDNSSIYGKKGDYIIELEEVD